MNDPRPPAIPEASPALLLPDLNQADLDWPGVEALLGDIETLTQVTEIILKSGPQQFVTDTAPLTLVQARDVLRQRSARAVQIRYRHDGADWWDTLMILPGCWKLVRVRHEFPAPERPS